MFTHLYRQSISYALASVLLGNTLFAEAIVVDEAAPLFNQPQMDVTANGIPLVNIVTPGVNGLSHNKFSAFSIEQKGVILNNATNAVQTQLGGWVQGNANLGTTPARVILNEVTGTNRSLLQGYAEVAGHRADLIIANPNGITVNGGGFINTARATLTTGMPQISGNTLSGFYVRHGDISIEGDGLNASNIDRVDLYTKALRLNAEIHAKKLDVVTGQNSIALDGTVVADEVVGNAEFSIDSGALGGIYGEMIRLVGTDKGVGINLPPIAYAGDSLELTADGEIVIATAIAEHSLRSQSSELIVNKKMYAGNIDVEVSDAMRNKGAIIADTLNISGGDIVNDGGIIGTDTFLAHTRQMTNNGVLYSAKKIDIAASDLLLNAEGAYIVSGGDIIIHDSGTVRNEAATIDAQQDLSIDALSLENFSTNVPDKSSVTSSISITDYFAPEFRDHRTTTTTIEAIDKTGFSPAYIMSGNDMMIDAAIHNRYSMISANRDLYLSGSLNNEAAVNAHEIIDISHYVEHWEKHGKWGKHAWYHNYSYYEHSDTILDHVYSTIWAGRNLHGNLIGINNADVVAGIAPINISSNEIPESSHFTDLIADGSYTLPEGDYGRFVAVSNPSLPYLIESNPLYTDFNTFISSDYIMDRLHLDSAANTKRLGDAAYETQLVRDAVFRLSGERYLAGFGNDTAQYRGLMDNALLAQGDLNLEFGVTLSSEQVRALNRDIVWMEEREVSGQRVLVPVVYLASLKNQELTQGGKIIAGGDVALALDGALSNAGEVRAGGVLLAQADRISNTGGTIKSASDMLLRTTNDITNTSGTIRGNNVALISDNGNIVSQSATKSIDLNEYAGTTGKLSAVGERAEIWAKGNLIAGAAKDITLTGAETSAGGNIALSGENVTLSALEQNSLYKTTWAQGSSEIEKIKQHTSILTAGGDTNIDAANDITVNSSNIAGKEIALNAGGNIAVTASNDREFTDVRTSYKGTFASGSSRDTTLKESVVSSAINGNNIAITSGKDTTLQAANLKAAQNIQVDAAGDINVLAKAYREAELHQESKSSFGGLVSSASLDSTDAVKLHEATLKTEAKNIIMNSGKDLTIVASNVSAGDAIGLAAIQNVNVLSDEEQKTKQYYSKKSGLGLGLNDGMLTVSEEKQTQDAKADITQKSAILSANTVVVEAGQDVTSIGSNIVASTIDVNAQRDVNILSATESASHQHKESIVKAGIGVTLNMNEASIFAGVITKSDKLGEGQTQEVSTQLLGDNIIVHSGNNTNVLASNVFANNDVSIHADKNINILSEDATAYKNQVHEELKAGIKVGVEQHVTNAAKQLSSNAQSLSKSDNAVNAASMVLRSIDLVSNTLSHSISVGFDAIAEMSKSETSAQSTSAQSSTIAAGHDVTLDAGKEVTVAGSDVIAGNKISMNAESITLKSSAQNTSFSLSDKSGSFKVTLFGTREGQVDASYAQAKNQSNDTTQRDAYVSGNDVIINTSGDTTLKGAHVSGNTVTANVGGNLNLISIQDTGSSKGDSNSIAISTGGSVNVGAGKSSRSKAWVEEQTGIIATKQADITVAGNTDLKGAIIATIDRNGNDVNSVHLTTGTLSARDIADYDKSTSMSIGLGNITAAQFQTNSKDTTGGTLEAGYGYSDKEQINRATIGGGTIALTSQESVSGTLNRDIAKAQEITEDESKNYDIYASENSINSVLNPTQTAEKWKQAAKDIGLSVRKEITENLPGSNDNGLAGVVGGGLDAISGLGILPSQRNGGGYVTQIAIQLFGDNRSILQSKDEAKFIALGLSKENKDYSEIKNSDGTISYVTNPNKTVRLTKNAEKDGNFDDMKLYIDETKAIALGLDKLFTNGIMNSVAEALQNQREQQGNPSIALLNYNQTHGIVGDLIEVGQDKLAVTTNMTQLATGGARQSGEIKTQLTKLTNGNLNSAAHSAGTVQDYLGTKLNQDEIGSIVQNNPNAKFTTQYDGSPVSSDAAGEFFREIYGGEQRLKDQHGSKDIENIFKSSVNPGDLVAMLGGNSAGINNRNDFWKNLGYDLTRGLPTLFNGGLEANLDNPDQTSSHSGYKCVIGCGESGITPSDKRYYFDPATNSELTLDSFYRAIHTDPSYSNVYIPQAGDKK